MSKLHETLAKKLQLKRYFFVEYNTLFSFGFDFYAKEKPFYRHWFSILTVLFMIVLSIASAHFIYSHIEHVDLVAESLTPFIKIILALWKYAILYMKQREIIDFVHRIWKISKDVSEKESKILRYENERASKMNIIYFGSIFLSVCVGTISPLVAGAITYSWNGEFRSKMPALATYIVKLDNPMNFCIIYALDIYVIFGVVCLTVGMDTLFCWGVHNIVAQFRILQLKMESLAEQAHWSYQRSIKFTSIPDCIAFHQQTLELAQCLDDIFCPMALAEFTINSIPICFGAFQIGRGADISQTLALSCFILFILTQLLLFSYGGEYLENRCDLVATTIFECINWEDWSIAERKIMLLKLIRAQRPCKMTAIFFDVNMTAFVTVVQTAASYVTLLRSIST